MVIFDIEFHFQNNGGMTTLLQYITIILLVSVMQRQKMLTF